MEERVERLFTLLKKGVTPFHVVEEAKKQLEEAGFEELSMKETWGISQGKKYYLIHHGTTLIAFTVAKNAMYREGFKMAAAHTDFPSLRIKPNPEVHSDGYGQLNVEVYGGPILNTWLDRPLGIAGKVALKGENAFTPQIRYVKSRRGMVTIPNLAIHMNPEINKGIELNRQNQILPIAGIDADKKFFAKYLAKELGAEEASILSYDLYLYNEEKPEVVGMEEELISAPRLDNLTSVQALLDGITAGLPQWGINLIALFDHEEIGSRSKQGAGSMLLRDVTEKIQMALGRDAIQSKDAIYNSMLISADVAHAAHPNWPGKTDITNKPVLGSGFCIKEAGNQNYATDCEGTAIVQQICEEAQIPYQKYVNRSDVRGGSALGSIVDSFLPLQTVEVGVPLLAMHSARETMGTKDMEALSAFMKTYFLK